MNEQLHVSGYSYHRVSDTPAVPEAPLENLVCICSSTPAPPVAQEAFTGHLLRVKLEAQTNAARVHLSPNTWLRRERADFP